MRPVASLIVVLAAVAAFPTAARAGDPCTEQAALESSLCRADRPFATIAVAPAAPRAGAPVDLTASSWGRGVTYAWDLDGDGAFDDATGGKATATFAGATARVGVRATDDAGRTATETRTFELHPFNTRPSGKLTVTPGSARVGGSVSVDAAGSDPDGRIAKVELDLDGDGTYERTGAQQQVTYASAGERTIRARFTDDAGGTAVVTSTLDVHAEDLPPHATLQLAAADGSLTIGRPLIAGGAVVTAYAGDPDGTIASYDFDLDGDGTYETPAQHVFDSPSGRAATVTTAFTAGEHEIGVRVTGDGGSTAVTRESVLAVPEWPIAGPHAPPVVLELAGRVVRPGVPVSVSAANLEGGGSYAWDIDGDGFDDGDGHTVQLTFPTAGEYTVRVKASGPGGERVAMATVSVREAPALPPVLQLTLPAAVHAGVDASFDAYATTADGLASPIGLTFDLDHDGAFDDDPTGAFGYSWVFPAATEVAVKATDGAGRTAIRTAEVAPAPGNLGPQADWIVSPVGFPDPAANGAGPLFLARRAASFAGWGTDVDGGGCCAVAWDGDGDRAYDDGTVNSLARTFGAGEHTVGLRATDADGAVAETRRTFTVGTRVPKASIAVADSVVTATATDPDGDAIAATDWDLDGDRAFDDASGPSARALEGEHLVGVRVTDAGGDIGIAYARVTGDPLPVVSTPPDVLHSWPPPARDQIAPSLTATAKAPRLATLLKRGLPVAVHCSEACRVIVVATVSKATARKLKLGGTVDLAHSTKALAAGAKVTVTLRLSLKAERAIKRVKSLKLTITTTATDASGNRAAKKKTVTIRR